jgi:hypothetical protein
MNKLENYDFNVYGDSDTTICLTAYPLRWIYDETYDNNRKLDCDYSADTCISLRLEYPQHLREIEHLLKDLYINNYPLTDYDDWLGVSDLEAEHPTLIQKFLDELPENKLEEDN